MPALTLARDGVAYNYGPPPNYNVLFNGRPMDPMIGSGPFSGIKRHTRRFWKRTAHPFLEDVARAGKRAATWVWEDPTAREVALKLYQQFLSPLVLERTGVHVSPETIKLAGDIGKSIIHAGSTDPKLVGETMLTSIEEIEAANRAAKEAQIAAAEAAKVEQEGGSVYRAQLKPYRVPAGQEDVEISRLIHQTAKKLLAPSKVSGRGRNLRSGRGIRRV